MGAIKSSKKKSTGIGGVVKKAKSVVSKLTGKRVSGKRRGRMTPERLAKKLLVIKLQKKIWKAKYGGR